MVRRARSRSRTRKIGTFTPCASKSRVTPSDSNTSIVRACTTQAREVFAPAGCRSMISGSAPSRLSSAASARPVGPAPGDEHGGIILQRLRVRSFPFEVECRFSSPLLA